MNALTSLAFVSERLAERLKPFTTLAHKPVALGSPVVDSIAFLGLTSGYETTVLNSLHCAQQLSDQSMRETIFVDINWQTISQTLQQRVLRALVTFLDNAKPQPLVIMSTSTQSYDSVLNNACVLNATHANFETRVRLQTEVTLTISMAHASVYAMADALETNVLMLVDDCELQEHEEGTLRCRYVNSRTQPHTQTRAHIYTHW